MFSICLIKTSVSQCMEKLQTIGDNIALFRMKLSIFIVTIIVLKIVNCFEYCPAEYTYVPGIGCYLFGRVSGGLTWAETFFYCDQLGGVVVSWTPIFLIDFSVPLFTISG